MSSKEKSLKAGDEVEVLYQRMGDRWFAFSLIDDEVFVGSITPEELEAEKAVSTDKRRKKVYREAGNS